MILSFAYLFLFAFVTGTFSSGADGFSERIVDSKVSEMEKLKFGPAKNQTPSKNTNKTVGPDLLEHDEEDDDDHDDKPDDDDRIRKKGSLAFVFDTTGSMKDEMKELIEGGKKIVENLRNRPHSPIRNYVFVPFNDPSIGPVTVTTDSKAFIKRMQSVTIEGGGDCPEVVLGGLKKALEVSLPNSYIFVFTDAPTHKTSLYKEIISLVQLKRAKVFFILTKGCLDENMQKYALYDFITQRSSGQIFKVDAGDFQQILKFIDHVHLVPNQVILHAADRNATAAGKFDERKIEVDNTLDHFTAAVTGINSEFQIFDPKGKQLNLADKKNPSVQVYLNLANVKVVRVVKPAPGTWSIKVKSLSVYNLKVYSTSKIHFNYAFSKASTSNFAETNSRPLEGVTSNILIRIANPDPKYKYSVLDMTNLGGDKMKSFTMKPVAGKHGYYTVSDFKPPKEFFMLTLLGTSDKNAPKTVRVTQSAIAAGVPEKPVVTMAKQAMRKLDKPARIKCKVQSLVPVTVTWMKDGKPYGKMTKCSESCLAVLSFDKITSSSAGAYTCKAKNAVGEASKVLNLSVGYPPAVQVRSPQYAVEKDDVTLKCEVTTQFPTSIKWYESKDGTTSNLRNLSPGSEMKNNSLFIKSVSKQHEGHFVCVAKSKGGKTRKAIQLLVYEKAHVHVEPAVVYYKDGGCAVFNCTALDAKNEVEWVLKPEYLKDSSIKIVKGKGYQLLQMTNLGMKHQGCYPCKVKNSSGYVGISHLVYNRGKDASQKSGPVHLCEQMKI